MSAIIKNMVLRKRQQEADASERERFLAQAKGDTGPKGERGLPGAPGRPPLHEWLGTSLRVSASRLATAADSGSLPAGS